MVEWSKQAVVDPNAGSLGAAWPRMAPAEARARVWTKVVDNVLETETDSQDAAFETKLSLQPWNCGHQPDRVNIRASCPLSDNAFEGGDRLRTAAKPGRTHSPGHEAQKNALDYTEYIDLNRVLFGVA